MYNNNEVYIYALKDPRDNRVRYIGKSVNIKNRYLSHLNTFDGTNLRKENWIKSLLDKGLKPVVEIIEICNRNNWADCEKYWIKKFRAIDSDLTNISDGGDDSFNSLASRNFRVKKFATEHNLELKKCFICGGLTVARIEICTYCLRVHFSEYSESDWYRYLTKDHKREYRENKIFADSTINMAECYS